MKSKLFRVCCSVLLGMGAVILFLTFARLGKPNNENPKCRLEIKEYWVLEKNNKNVFVLDVLFAGVPTGSKVIAVAESVGFASDEMVVNFNTLEDPCVPLKIDQSKHKWWFWKPGKISEYNILTEPTKKELDDAIKNWDSTLEDLGSFSRWLKKA